MDTDGPPYFADVVLLRGWAAYALARLLSRQHEAVAVLPPHLRAPIEASIEALELAGARWASGRGSAEAVIAETAPDSNSDEITTEEAGRMLNVTTRRVRQLAAEGRLAGRRRAGRWCFDRGAAAAYVEERTERP